jgi:hypothetical protein
MAPRWRSFAFRSRVAMLFKGQGVSRQAGLGLFWLIVAKDSASATEGWITDTYGSAFAQATDEERALAYKYLENWVKRRASPAAAARE